VTTLGCSAVPDRRRFFRHHIASTMLAPIIGVNTINAPARNMPSDSASSFIPSCNIIGAETG
jgi:hypothetical protein